MNAIVEDHTWTIERNTTALHSRIMIEINLDPRGALQFLSNVGLRIISRQQDRNVSKHETRKKFRTRGNIPQSWIQTKELVLHSKLLTKRHARRNIFTKVSYICNASSKFRNNNRIRQRDKLDAQSDKSKATRKEEDCGFRTEISEKRKLRFFFAASHTLETMRGIWFRDRFLDVTWKIICQG